MLATKQIAKKLSLQIPAGKATPAPPVGTILGPAGVNLQEFCTKYNDATRDKMGDIVPVEITIYDDRSYDFKLKTSPAAAQIKKYAGVKSGGTKGKNQIVGSITEEQVRKIAEDKMSDLNANDIDAAIKIIKGTALNMGIEIKN